MSSAPAPNPLIPFSPSAGAFGSPGGVNLMSTGVNIAVSVLIGSCLLLGICAGFIRVRRQQRAHQAWLAQRQRGAINRAVQVFGARLHEEEVILDPALNPFTPQPLLVVSPDGQQVAVARQYKDSMDSPTAGQTGANNAEKPASIPHGLSAAGAEALAHDLDVASRQGVAGVSNPSVPGTAPEAAGGLHHPLGNRLKVKTYWTAYALLDPERDDLQHSFARESEPMTVPADDVVLEVRQNIEAMRTGGEPSAAGAPRRLGLLSSLKAAINPRQHFPEDGTLAAVPEASAPSGRSRSSGIQSRSGLQRGSRGANYVGQPVPGRLAPLPAERPMGSTGRSNALLDSNASAVGLLDARSGVEMTRARSQERPTSWGGPSVV